MALIPYAIIFAGLSLLTGNCLAAETKLTVPMDYSLIRNVLLSQLYTGEGATARVWKDGKQCSFLDMANPQISGENGQVKIRNSIHARIGMQFGGQCVPAVEWSGILQTLQKPNLDASGNVLSFPITAAQAFDQNGQMLNIGQLQELINKAVQPKLAGLKIDLHETRPDIVKTLQNYVDDSEKLHEVVDSLRFVSVNATDKALQLSLGFNGLSVKKSALANAPVLSSEELQQWQSIWLGWQMSLEQRLSQPPLDNQSAQTKELLSELMQEAGVAFEQGLTESESGKNDPVRNFFSQSWDKLAPLLRSASNKMPGAEGLRYLTLIAATDLMYELEAIGAPLGLDISSNGLRKLARAYIKHQAGSGKV